MKGGFAAFHPSSFILNPSPFTDLSSAQVSPFTLHLSPKKGAAIEFCDRLRISEVLQAETRENCPALVYLALCAEYHHLFFTIC
jgi:hypothetical protein